MIGARSGAATSVTSSSRPWRLERAAVGAPLDRGRRGEHPDPAALGDRRRDLGLGLDHGHHLDPVLAGDLPRRVPARRGRRVAGDHSSFAPRSSRKRVDLRDRVAQPSWRLGPVREVGGVAEVEEVLLRQRDEALVQDGEPADPGVEDGDRQRPVEQGSLEERLGGHHVDRQDDQDPRRRFPRWLTWLRQRPGTRRRARAPGRSDRAATSAARPGMRSVASPNMTRITNEAADEESSS